METKETQTTPWCGRGKKGKKIIVGILMLVILLAGVALIFTAHREFSNRGYSSMMDGRNGRQGNGAGQVSPITDGSDQFVMPSDVAKSGEVAVVVADIEKAKKGVAEIALQENGSVYATFISYASNDVKNGSIIVQVPAEKFDEAFDSLKGIGSNVIQESTRQFPPRNAYAYPQPLAAPENTKDTSSGTKDSSNDSSAVDVSSEAAQPSVMMYPGTIQLPQDKGYIRVVFVDYGNAALSGQKIENFGAKIIGVGYVGQNMRNNLWVVLAIKSILLIVLVTLLVIIIKKIFRKLRSEKMARKAAENAPRKPQIRMAQRKPVVHVVRQASKTRSKVVKTAKRK